LNRQQGSKSIKSFQVLNWRLNSNTIRSLTSTSKKTFGSFPMRRTLQNILLKVKHMLQNLVPANKNAS